jgi:hypothetical protein
VCGVTAPTCFVRHRRAIHRIRTARHDEKQTLFWRTPS